MLTIALLANHIKNRTQVFKNIFTDFIIKISANFFLKDNHNKEKFVVIIIINKKNRFLFHLLMICIRLQILNNSTIYYKKNETK
jgi:hypothetical protein